MNVVEACETQLSADHKKILESFRFKFALSSYRKSVQHRNDALFCDFLPKGYLATTLTSVEDQLSQQAVLAKIHLGMLITLYDDFTDNPSMFNSRLLEELYKIPFSMQHIHDGHLTREEQGFLELGIYLGQFVISSISEFPCYSTLRTFFEFDLNQFYQANRCSQLLTCCPSAANGWELALYGPHNMGMVAAWSI